MKRSIVFLAVVSGLAIATMNFLPASLAQRPQGQMQRQLPDRPQLGTEPLTLPALTTLLRQAVGRNMSEADLAVHVERVGIGFDLTPEIIARLRANGAHPHLLNTIKRQAEKLSASAGKLTTTAEASPDTFMVETRKNVRDYLEELPDFICQQEVQRYYDIEGSGAWEKADTLTYEVTYNRKRESYKPINAVGRPVTKSLEQSGGAYSTGDFASALATLLDPESKATFKPAGKEKLGNRPTVIYDFRVPKETSKQTVEAQGALPLIVGYSGSIWVDTEKKLVLRIEQAVDDLPKSYPLTNAERTVDYDMIKVRGIDVDFLLPIRAEILIGDRRQKQESRNVLLFKFYRKFETDIKILDDSQLTPPTKPPF